MFTGIIETIGKVTEIKQENTNLHLTIKANFTNELKIDQSVAHNGICLTVVDINSENKTFTVTAIDETIKKTTIGTWKTTDEVNLERGLRLGDRLDGHIVQGHVDEVGVCKQVTAQNGSTIFSFQYNENSKNITIEKGSITINGVSLTVINSGKNTFEVAIIPYTLAHTTFKNITIGSLVNLEFDVVGKYITKMQSLN